MLFIPVEELKGRKRSALLKFLARYEEICVQLSAQMRKTSDNVYVVFASEVSEQDLYGIVSVRKTILHCLPYANSEEPTAMQKDFVQSFTDFFCAERFDMPVCVNGTHSGTALILEALSLLEYVPSQINEYNLMKLDIGEFKGKVRQKAWLAERRRFAQKHGIEVLRCRRDIPAEMRGMLFELQKQYELEEVVPSCLSFDENLCRLRLANSFRTQYILALLKKEGDKELLVSKAGTNAVGIKCAQIGGVFTHSEYRGRGFCSYLMGVLMFKIVKMRYIPVLFVKKQNELAVKLYASLGFTKIADYTIGYFSLIEKNMK